jgi:predicted metal-dependent phosphoesterase TrpH
MFADLHCHSLYSDGASMPDVLAARAKGNQLDAVVLTDHDNCFGWQEMRAACVRLGLKTVPGIELSSFLTCDVHILGYNFDASESGVVAKSLIHLQDVRRERIERTVQRLCALGLPLTMEEVAAQGHGVPSRGLVAAVMVQKGYVATAAEAFASYLWEKGAAYVEHYALTPAAAVRLVLEGGGVPVLAHPGRIAMDAGALAVMVDDLARAGLAGIECLYPTHDKNTTDYFLAMAKRHDLLVTGGSDYHRPGSSSVAGYRQQERTCVRLGVAGAL